MYAVMKYVVVTLILLGQSSSGFRVDIQNAGQLYNKQQQVEQGTKVVRNGLTESNSNHTANKEEPSVEVPTVTYYYPPAADGRAMFIPSAVTRVPAMMPSRTVSFVAHSASSPPVNQGTPAQAAPASNKPRATTHVSRLAPPSATKTTLTAGPSAAAAVRVDPGPLRWVIPKKADVGKTVEISGKEYVLQELKGQGSFGSVFRAKGEEGDVAIKFADADKTKIDEYKQAKMEIKLLQLVSQQVAEADDADLSSRRLKNHLSTYIADDEETNLPGQPRSKAIIRLVMYYTAGKDIDGTTPEIKGNSSLDRATGLTLSLLTQMTALFNVVRKVCVHRDVNPRNILVDVKSQNFVLIDFGLGVHNEAWSGNGWQRQHVAGDPRYWTLGAWEIAVWGIDALKRDRWANGSSVADNYVNRADHFGLGLVALEMFLELAEPELRALPELPELKEALDRYFRFVRSIHAKLVQGAEDARSAIQYMQRQADPPRVPAGGAPVRYTYTPITNFQVLKRTMEDLNGKLFRAIDDTFHGSILRGIAMLMGIESKDPGQSWREVSKWMESVAEKWMGERPLTRAA